MMEAMGSQQLKNTSYSLHYSPSRQLYFSLALHTAATAAVSPGSPDRMRHSRPAGRMRACTSTKAWLPASRAAAIASDAGEGGGGRG